MANIGEIGEIVNSSETTLVVGGNTYIMLQDLNIHIGRPEFRDPTTDAGALYTYGKGDHWMTFTLLATTPELDTLAALNDIDSDGDMSSTAWTIVAKNVSAASKTFTCTGILNPIDIRKAPEGKLFVDCFVRITPDTVVVA